MHAPYKIQGIGMDRSRVPNKYHIHINMHFLFSSFLFSAYYDQQGTISNKDTYKKALPTYC